jgi:uncharacterized tellurite resistance protein B-like protein
MITSIKEYFSKFIEPGTRPDAVGGAHALQVATAALLLEMMRMDARLTAAEHDAIAATLRREFALGADELATLVALADQEARQAHGYHQFTALINRHCDAEQKARIVENLWHVAMVDGHLDAHELHLMRKLADLLHVGHADYVAAKQRARARANLPAG